MTSPVQFATLRKSMKTQFGLESDSEESEQNYALPRSPNIQERAFKSFKFEGVYRETV